MRVATVILRDYLREPRLILSTAMSAPLVLNLATGAITSQFHVVFDDWFVTVASSIADLTDFNSPEWQRMFGDSVFQYVDEEDLPPDDASPYNDRYEHVMEAVEATAPPASPSCSACCDAIATISFDFCAIYSDFGSPL